MLPDQTYTPDDFLRIARRRMWLIILPLLAVSAGVGFFARTLPDKFRSETLILVVPQRVPESYVRSTITSRIEDRLSTISQQILSRSRLEHIIEEFDMYPKERQTMAMEDVVERMRPDIHINIERGDAFRVGHDNENPQLAQRVTERLASLFINENLRDREVLAEGTNQFLDAQLEDAKRRLIEHEKRLETYRLRHAGELPSQVDANLQAIQTTQMQMQQLSESVNRDKERRLELERRIIDLESATAPVVAAGPASTPDQPVVGESSAQQLDVARARLSALEQRYRPEHPDVLAARRLIRDLEARVQAENAARPATPDQPARPPVSAAEANRQSQLRAMRNDLTRLEAQMATKESDGERLRGLLASYQSKVDVAPARESELVELTRDYATLQNGYTSLLAKREESKISANLERRQVGEQFRVLDPARVPERPFSPNRTRIYAMGALAGLAIGLGLVALLEFRDRSFKNADDFTRVLQLPVLALVPLMQSERELLAKRRRKLLAGLAVGLATSASAAAYAIWTLNVF